MWIRTEVYRLYIRTLGGHKNVGYIQEHEEDTRIYVIYKNIRTKGYMLYIRTWGHKDIVYIQEHEDARIYVIYKNSGTQGYRLYTRTRRGPKDICYI